MTRIWLANWHFQSRITLWCRHKSSNVSMGLCWQMPKFIVWRLWSIYFDHNLSLKPSIGKRRKQSCIPNINRRSIPMDSLLSPIVADIVLQDFEEKTLNMLNVNLSFYYLFYVDDKIMAYGIIDILPLPIRFHLSVRSLNQ